MTDENTTQEQANETQADKFVWGPEDVQITEPEETPEFKLDGRTKRALDTAIAKKQVSQESYRTVTEGRIDLAKPGAKRHLTEIVQLLQTYARLTELEIAAGGKPERGTVALGADLYEKLLQRFIAVQEGTQEEGEEQAQQAREGDGEEAGLSEMEALAEDYISMTGKTGKDAAALRHVMRT